MTDHTTAAKAAMQEAVLTGDEIRRAVAIARSMNGPSDATQPGEYVLAGALALLSKLRAPVAEEPMREVLQWILDDACSGGVAKLRPQQEKRARAALEGTTVAGERAALAWYAEQVEGCRKLGSIGDPYRHALDNDGGKRARDALASAPIPEGLATTALRTIAEYPVPEQDNMPAHNMRAVAVNALASAPVANTDELSLEAQEHGNRRYEQGFAAGWDQCVASAPVAGEAVSSIRVFVKDGKVSHPASYGPRLADGFHTFYAAPQASESVVVQFAGVGSAGPFPVVDKHVTLPEATMQDLAQRLAPQASEAVPTEPLRVFSAGMWTYDGTGQAFSHTELDEAAFVTYRAALSAQPAAIRNPLIAEQSAQPGAQKEGSDAG